MTDNENSDPATLSSGERGGAGAGGGKEAAPALPTASAAPATIDDDSKPMTRAEMKAFMAEQLKDHSTRTAAELTKQNATALARQNFITKEMAGVPQAYWEKLPHTDDAGKLREAKGKIVDQLNADMKEFFERFPRGKEARELVFPSNMGSSREGGVVNGGGPDTSRLTPEQKIAVGMRG